MFLALYLINSLTDILEGYVYNILVFFQLILALFTINGEKFPYLAFILGLLIVNFIFDREEKYLGRGDYGIIFSHVAFRGFLLAYDMILASILAIFYSFALKKKRVPLVPFLFLGLLFTRLIIA